LLLSEKKTSFGFGEKKSVEEYGTETNPEIMAASGL